MTTPHNPRPWLDRRMLLQRAAVLGLLITPAGALVAGCGKGDGGMPMTGGSGSPMPGWMMSDGMMDPAMTADMPVIMDLLGSHQAIQRSVDDVDGGIASRTTSSDPRIAGLIATSWRL